MEHKDPRQPNRRRRAKPIAQDIWDEFYPKLVQLYQEDCLPRREIISIMKRKHNITLTDRQLKCRYQKWGAAKYINGRDMSTILALRRKHQAAGKDILVKYKGFEIDSSRIERAAKRWKTTLPNTAEPLPAHIAITVVAFEKHQQDPQQPLPAESTQRNIARKPVVTPQFIDFCHTIRQLDSGPSDSFPAKQSHNRSVSPFLDPTQLHLDDSGARSVGAGDPRALETAQTVRLTPSNEGFTITKQFSGSPKYGSSEQSANTERVFEAEIDWSSWLELSPRPSTFAMLDASSDFFERNGSSAHDPKAPPLLPPSQVSPNDPSDLFQDRSILDSVHSEVDGTTGQYCNRISLSDCDAEEMIRPLQLMTSTLGMSLDPAMTQWDVHDGSTLADLAKIMRSRWLTVQLERLLQWAYEAAKRSSLRRSMTARVNEPLHSSLEDNVGFSGEFDVNEPVVRQRSIAPEKQTKVTSYWLNVVPKGALSLRLKTASSSTISLESSTYPSILSIAALPKTTNRSVGVTATFVSPIGACPHPDFSPQLAIFNLVPEDSAVIKAVSSNNMREVQRLFDRGEASARDVDPRGFSLLSYSMYTGCSDVFRLLLENGVGIQNCERFGNSLDAVWAIWSYFVVFNSDDHDDGKSGGYLKNFEQCIAMTDTVLKYRCDIGETVGYSARPNVLFEFCYYWPISRVHPTTPARALDYLIEIGYELEQSSHEGQTPLLWTASAYQPQVIKCLRLFIKKGANICATDEQGRGALHCAFLVPHILDGWRTLGLISQGVHISKFYYLPSHVYHTEDTAHAEDYTEDKNEVAAVAAQQWLESMQAPGIARSGIIEPQWLDNSFVGQITNSQQVQRPASDKDKNPDQEPLPRVLCRNHTGNEYFIQDPVTVLKTRLKHKLLTLLNAGCDPNVFDIDGFSPSDYARRDGLWVEWVWALERQGYEYDVKGDRWIRS